MVPWEEVNEENRLLRKVFCYEISVNIFRIYVEKKREIFTNMLYQKVLKDLRIELL